MFQLYLMLTFVILLLGFSKVVTGYLTSVYSAFIPPRCASRRPWRSGKKSPHSSPETGRTVVESESRQSDSAATRSLQASDCRSGARPPAALTSPQREK